MNYSKFEIKVIKEIFKIRKKGTNEKFKELFECLFEAFFYDIGIEITSNKITILFDEKASTNYINLKKDEIYEFIILFSKLNNEFDFFVPSPQQNEYKFFSYNFNNNQKNRVIIELENNEVLKNILNNLLNSYFFSSKLREQKNREFRSVEEINLKFTKCALITTAFFNIISTCINAYETFLKK